MHLSFPRPRQTVLVSFSAASLLLLAACGGNSTSTSQHHGSGHGSDGASHPSSHEMGGMESGHHTDPGMGLMSSEDGYRLKAAKSALSVGKQTLRFQILAPDGRPQTDYVVDQTKLLHFYLVRNDLTGYQHLHPMLANGTWSIEVDPAAPGPYRMYTDFIAKDSAGKEHPLVLSTLLTAPGRYTPTPLPAASTTSSADGITATASGTLTSGMESKLAFQITEGGKPVSDLQPYLDSFAHLTALHVGDGAYQHVHPELTASPGQQGGPTLPFTVDLPEKGSWRLFLQVQRAGQLHLLPLTVTVV